jgi:nitrate/TMAO reductase-like tetraheme cytochrome c subunit
MDEKRTFWETIKANKKKIIVGALIVVGVGAGVVFVVKAIQAGTAINEEGQVILEGLTDRVQEATEVLGEAANIVS